MFLEHLKHKRPSSTVPSLHLTEKQVFPETCIEIHKRLSESSILDELENESDAYVCKYLFKIVFDFLCIFNDNGGIRNF